MRTVTIIDKQVIKNGTSSSGKPWTLYEVTAVTEAGDPIEEKLKTFDDLTGTVQVEVERTEHEKYGVSYMLKLPRGEAGSNPAPAGARLGPKVDDIRERVEALEREMAEVKRALAGGQQSPTSEPGPAYGRAPDGASF